jgi:hypothetical protein
MNDTEIEAKINEFKSYYENGLTCLHGCGDAELDHMPGIESWLRTTLTNLIQSHEEDMRQLKLVHQMELDAISCKSIEQFVLWRDERKLRPKHVDLSKTDVTE